MKIKKRLIQVPFIIFVQMNHSDKIDDNIFSISGNTLEFSQNGANLEIPSKIPTNRKYIIHFSLYNSKLEIEAIPIWAKKNKNSFIIGTQFINISSHHKEIISQFLYSKNDVNF